MQREILEKNPEAEVRVYAVWFDVLSSDDRSAWSPSLMSDSRVVHLWDEEKAVALWLPDQEEYRDLVRGPLAWDIYFLYGPEATWDRIPWPVVSSGSTIIGKSADLQRHILPLLSQG